MNYAKEKALCTTAIVQSANTNEPAKAQTYLTATDTESQMFRDPERIIKLYRDQIAASGEEISETALKLVETAAQLACRAYRCGFADGQKGGDLHG